MKKMCMYSQTKVLFPQSIFVNVRDTGSGFHVSVESLGHVHILYHCGYDSFYSWWRLCAARNKAYCCYCRIVLSVLLFHKVYVRIRDEEWNVYRRYSQFLDTHLRLKKVYPIVGKFDFPPKKAIGKKVCLKHIVMFCVNHFIIMRISSKLYGNHVHFQVSFESQL